MAGQGGQHRVGQIREGQDRDRDWGRSKARETERVGQDRRGSRHIGNGSTRGRVLAGTSTTGTVYWYCLLVLAVPVPEAEAGAWALASAGQGRGLREGVLQDKAKGKMHCGTWQRAGQNGRQDREDRRTQRWRDMVTRKEGMGASQVENHPLRYPHG